MAMADDDEYRVLDMYYEGVILWRTGERSRTLPCDTRKEALLLARKDEREDARAARAIWTRQRSALEPPNDEELPYTPSAAVSLD